MKEFTLDQVLKKYPDLNMNGLERLDNFEESRQGLMGNQALIWAVMQCLKENCSQKKAQNKKRTSYGLKHDVEDSIGSYVSNGQVILAALMLGYKIKEIYKINCTFNMNMPKDKCFRFSSEAFNVFKAMEKLTGEFNYPAAGSTFKKSTL